MGEVNLIDVGCHKAHFLDAFQRQFRVGYSIGIDPCNYGVGHRYTKYYETAIVDTNVKEVSFNEYEEPGCNSILEMDTKNVVHDRSQPGWYVGWSIENKIRTRTVPATKLCNILAQNTGVLPIHYLKVDAQGFDINVVKSLEEYIEQVHFIQLECVSLAEDKHRLYHGQQGGLDDIRDMEKLGFEVFGSQDHSANASPEADILFRNLRFK